MSVNIRRATKNDMKSVLEMIQVRGIFNAEEFKEEEEEKQLESDEWTTIVELQSMWSMNRRKE